MIRKTMISLLALVLLACQKSPMDAGKFPDDTIVSNGLAKRGSWPVGFTLHETGYAAETLLENITAPEGTDMLGNGVLYVLQSTIGNILKVTPSGKITEFAKIPFEEPPAPALVDLLIDPPRGMFVTLLRHGKIFNVTFNGKVSEFATDLNYPLFMVLDSEKRLYVSELYGFQVTRFNTSGDRTVVIALDSDNRPRGLAFDEQERLYVLSRNGEIRRFEVMTATSFPVPLSSGAFIATVPAGNVQDMTFGFDSDLFVVSADDIYRVKLSGEVSAFAAGLAGPYNVINTNVKGDLIVSDYGQAVEGAGKVIKIFKAAK